MTRYEPNIVRGGRATNIKVIYTICQVENMKLAV